MYPLTSAVDLKIKLTSLLDCKNGFSGSEDMNFSSPL